jgi:hypothetical protein
MKHTHSFLVVSSIIFISFLAVLVSAEAPQAADEDGQQVSTGESMVNPNPPIVILADPNVNLNRVPPPDWFTARDPAEALKPAGIIMNFLPAGSAEAKWGDTTIAWPADAMDAALYGALIWASGLNTTVPITINAGWVNNMGAGVLGHSGTLWFHRNFTGAPQTDTWYPVSLANTLHGSDLTPTDADIYMGFSSIFSWYTGTDGRPPNDNYDLVSVVLHEICHGLGFAGSMGYSGGQGSWGLSTPPTNPIIYDRFTEDNSGVSLLNTTTYPNPSTALGDALTGGNIFFNGFQANLANGGSRVPLYAPSTWNPGSSFSHLAESYNNTVNALMTYSLGYGESEHSPGPVTKGLLRDVGWTFTTIFLSPPTNFSATDGTYTDRVHLTWDACAGATHYRIYRSTQRSGFVAPITGEIIDTEYNDTSAIPGVTYYYWVKSGSAWSSSTLSTSETGNILGPPHTLDAQKGVSSNSIQVSWNTCIGATKYMVYRNTTDNPGTAQLLADNHTSTAYTDSGLPLATAYYYWIRSGNNNGWSSMSDDVLGYTSYEVAVNQGDWKYKDGKKNDKLKGKNIAPVLVPYLKEGFEIGIRDPVTDTIVNGPHTLTTKNEKVWFYKEKKAVIVKYKEIYKEKKDEYKTQVKYTVWGDIPPTNTVFVRKPGEPFSVVTEIEFNLVPAGKADEKGWRTLILE